MLTSNVQLGYILTRGGGASCPVQFIFPPSPRISERMDNQQFLLHHLLQKYLVIRDINFISISLRCSLQRFSWVTYWQGMGCKLSRAVCLAPPPKISERKDNQQFLLHHLLQKYLVERDTNFTSVNLKCLLQIFSRVSIDKGWGASCPGLFILPPTQNFSEINNPQILLHHLLQEYLVERDINFISVNLRCLLQTFSWVMYWQGVGGKLSRAVYLAPHPEFQRE